MNRHRQARFRYTELWATTFRSNYSPQVRKDDMWPRKYLSSSRKDLGYAVVTLLLPGKKNF